MIRVLIVDDAKEAGVSLKRNIESEPEIKVIGLASDGCEAIELCKREKPDVVLMDIRMEGMNGLQATKEIKRMDAGIKILMFTAFFEEKNILEAIQNDCDGFLLKGRKWQEIASAIKQVHSGLSVISNEVHKVLRKQMDLTRTKQHVDMSDLDQLSPKEVEMVKLITAGKKNSEIAELLFISDGHVRNLLSDIRSKLGLRNSKELAVWGAVRGL